MCGLSFCRGTLTRPRQFGSVLVEWLKDDAGDDGDDGDNNPGSGPQYRVGLSINKYTLLKTSLYISTLQDI